MDLLTTANLETSATSKKTNHGANSLELDDSVLPFPHVFSSQLNDLETDSTKSAVFDLPLDSTSVETTTAKAILNDGSTVGLTVNGESVNIGRSHSENEPLGGNFVPLKEGARLQAITVSHQQRLASQAAEQNVATAEPAAFDANSHNNNRITGTAGAVFGRLQDINSTTQHPRPTTAFPTGTSSESVIKQKITTDTLVLPLDAASSGTENSPESLRRLNSLSANGLGDGDQNSSSLSVKVASVGKGLESAEQALGKTPLPMNKHQAASLLNATPSSTAEVVSADVVANPLENSVHSQTLLQRAGATGEFSTIEQMKASSAIQQEQTLKQSIVGDHGMNSTGPSSVPTANSSPQLGLNNSSALASSKSSTKAAVGGVEMLATSITTLADEANQGLQNETLGFGSAQQPTQASSLVSKSGQTQYLGVAQFNDPQFSRNLNDQVLLMAGQGIQKAHISLNPHELGPVEIRLAVANDEVSVQLASINPAVRESIEQAMPRLRELFDEAGLKLGQHDVSSELADGQSSDSSEAKNRLSSRTPDSREPQLEEAAIIFNHNASNSIDTYI